CAIGSTFPTFPDGYYVGITPDDVLTIVGCIPTSSCPGTSTAHTSCAEGYGGEYCSECAKGYYRVGTVCTNCNASATSMSALFGFMAVFVLFFLVRSSHPNRKHSATLSLLVTWIQLISLYGELPLQWPQTILALLHFSSSLNFNIDLTATGCDSPLPFETKWMLTLGIPVFSLLVLGVL